MNSKIVKSVHSIIVIIIALALAAAFIFLSTSELKKDVDIAAESLDIENSYKRWGKKPKYETKQIDVEFQYDTRQVDDVHVINYKITDKTGDKTITQKEIDILLKCYMEADCSEKDFSQKTRYIIDNYKNYIVKDDVVVVYGLMPVNFSESFGEIENNIFVIHKELFAKIVDPVFSNTNKKYNNIRKEFLVNNMNIDYDDYDNEQRISKKDEMNKDALQEIQAENSDIVKEDLRLLRIIAESVEMVDKGNI
jgi:hypothetical protein